MRRNDDNAAAAVFPDEFVDFMLLIGIKAFGRLVKNKNARLVD